MCSEIVDRAQKELNIEKQIKKIEDTWSVLALVFTPLPDSDITALSVCRGHRHTCSSWSHGSCCSAFSAAIEVMLQLLKHRGWWANFIELLNCSLCQYACLLSMYVLCMYMCLLRRPGMWALLC